MISRTIVRIHKGEYELKTKDEKGTIKKRIKGKYLEFRELRNRKKLDRFIAKLRKSKSKSLAYAELMLEQSVEEWKINKIKEDAIKSKAYLAISLGCILLLGTLCVNIYFSSKTLDPMKEVILDAITSIINIVISMVVGIGVSTIVLDFFSYIQYTRERLKEIIIDKSFIKKLSDDEKKNVIFKAEESLYFKDGKLLPNSLYADVKKKITPLLESCYYGEFDVTISCDVDKEKRVIRKEILKNITIISNENDAVFKIPFSVFLQKPNGEEVRESYEVMSCVFRGEDVTSSFKDAQEEKQIQELERASSKDDTQFSFSENYSFKLKKGENTLQLRTKTTVPIEDNVYSHYFTLPCMRYTTTFNINTEGYSVSGCGFALEDGAASEDNKKNVSYSRIGNSLKIRIDEWALPGEGSVFIINPDSD